ncbi:hypothetical protein AMTR_s00007p00246910 [Amborella trichopoda]|uniref:Uncharacterized protein n=1 Tax=Amborella trichopoda TaxID=13333 RepID=W1P6E7_AMBTC|nr:hypothetical protein AMTR_s00007p00246910 [Amborella trichopoda]
MKWAYFRIISGTLIGGALGYYLKYKIEVHYKEKMRERLLSYNREMKKGETMDDTSELLSDS